MQLFDRIKQIRKRLSLSQLVFSQTLGISRSHISNIETGTAAPSEQLINLICATWGVDKEWLVNGHGELKIRYRGNITDKEAIDIQIEDMTFYKYNNLYNNLSLLSKTITNFIEFFDEQELDIASFDDFILDPENERNKQIIKESKNIEKKMEELKARIKKIKELKTYDEKGKVVPVSPKK